jgi:hypothetical protein
MTKITLGQAQAEMDALFDQARKDFKSGVLSSWQISRSLLSEFWTRYYKHPHGIAPEFMAWFRPQHEKLGDDFAKTWKPMKENRA